MEILVTVTVILFVGLLIYLTGLRKGYTDTKNSKIDSPVNSNVTAHNPKFIFIGLVLTVLVAFLLVGLSFGYILEDPFPVFLPILLFPLLQFNFLYRYSNKKLTSTNTTQSFLITLNTVIAFVIISFIVLAFIS